MNDHPGDTMQVMGLSVLSTGLNLAELDLHGGDGFWSEVRRFTASSMLDRQIDHAMGGRAAPRIWVFLEGPNAGHSAAAAALGAAWILADRGQMVVLVDCDEQSPWITRWLGRTEEQGWIDMVRFGASLQSSSVPLPSDARRGAVLGVGTFAPTGITPDEVTDLLNRLRRQADDLILVLPAKLRSLPWIEMAHIRLMCWDLLSRSTGDTERILEEMDRMGAKPDALLGFGVEEFSLIQYTLREEDGERPRAVPPAEEIDESDGVLSEEAGSSAAAVAEKMSAIQETDEGIENDIEALPADVRPRRRTSQVFLLIAAAAVLALVMLGWFLKTQLGPGRPGEDLAAVDETPSWPVVQVKPVQTEQPDEGLAEGLVEPHAPADDVPPDPGLEEPASDAAVIDEIASPDESWIDAAGADSLDWTPFRQEPGRDGWSLWIFSVPDERSAGAEVARLKHLGIEAAYRVVELPDQRVWWRIYAGSFSSRQDALEAIDSLLVELKHDWAVPERF